MNVYKIKQQAQEFILRLFIESELDDSTPSHYTCARCGTFSRLRQ